jgi:hypothetical protein
MAKSISFDEMENYAAYKRTPFFNLADDGDRAVVRFYHNNGDDIEKIPVHTVTVGDKTVKVACLRSPDESVDVCPLCEEGNLVSPRMYIKVLVYKQDEAGYYTRKPELQVWERGKGFRKQIQSIINRYASGNKSLMDTVFEIERSGKKGDTKTMYNIYKMDELEDNECILPEEDEIEDFSALGSLVADKTENELIEYLNTGKFPQAEVKKESSSRSRVQENEDDEEIQTPARPTGRRVSQTSQESSAVAGRRPRRV